MECQVSDTEESGQAKTWLSKRNMTRSSGAEDIEELSIQSPSESPASESVSQVHYLDKE